MNMHKKLSHPFARALLVALVSLLAVAGCGDDDDGAAESSNGVASNGTSNGTSSSNGATSNGNTSNQTSNGTAAGPSATFATYNVGLARGFVDYAVERLDPIVSALSTSDADVLCLQEVWLAQEEDAWSELQITALTEGTKSAFPHSYYAITMPVEEAVTCSQEEIDAIGDCALANCGDVEPGELSGCVLGMCGDEFGAASASCQGCAAANLGKPLQEILDACSPGGASGSAFAYNGHNGLLILSKHPISESGIEEFSSALTYRSALHAKVAIPTFGDVDVFCTHIASDLSADIDYPTGGEYTSFEAENAAQVTGIAEFVASAATTDNVVLMGDFNTGPTKGDAVGELEANYDVLLTATGLSNPYAEQDAPKCTYCPENTLVRSNEEHIIDHVLLGIANQATAEAERIYDATVSITTPDGAQDSHLSDHYGVSVKVTKTP